MKSVYLDCIPYIEDLLTPDLLALVPGLIVHRGDPSSQELSRLLAGAVAIINGHTQMDANLLATCSHLRSIVFVGTGASSYIDVSAAEGFGIRVRTVRNYGDRSIAEHAFGLILAAARKIAVMDRELRQGHWSVLDGTELAGKVLGVVGAGGVGRELIHIASAFGMNVLAWNRSEIPRSLPCRSVALDTLLRDSDVISLHLALTDETRGLINAQRLASMRGTAILVNTARGALVDERALVEVLQARRISHAALDVFTAEPLASNHPLLHLNNVTLTAHAAYKTIEATKRLVIRSLELLKRDLAAIESGLDLSSLS